MRTLDVLVTTRGDTLRTGIVGKSGTQRGRAATKWRGFLKMEDTGEEAVHGRRSGEWKDMGWRENQGRWLV